MHNIVNHRLPPDVIHIINLLHEKGFAAYLYGGTVRDLLLGKEVTDYDIVTNASDSVRNELINLHYANCNSKKQLKKAGKAVIDISSFDQASKKYIWVRELPHAEGSTLPESFSDNLDFTVNAMFYDIVSQSVLDYHGGLDDLRDKRLRTVFPPKLAMDCIPSISIRGLRLLAGTDFTLDPELEREMENASDYLSRIDHEYMFRQLHRFFNRGYAKNGYSILQAYGVMDMAFPPIARSNDREGYHNYLKQLTEKLDAFDFDAVSLYMQSSLVYAYILAPRVRELLQGMELYDAIAQVLTELGEYLPVNKLLAMDPKAVFCKLLAKVASSDSLDLPKIDSIS